LTKDSNDKFEKLNRKALSAAEAQALILQHASYAAAEELDLIDAIGRRLADDIKTREPIPHFRRSGMDGYAVLAEDVADASSSKPIVLEVAEHIPCGTAPKKKLVSGQASRIMTGGMVPDGADTVIMQEAAELVSINNREYVHIRKSTQLGSHITPIGEEAESGQMLLSSGQTIGAGSIAILASLGYARVKVFTKPKVAIISTGTELLEPSEPLQAGKIRNSNAYMIAAQVIAAGGEPLLIGQISDVYEQAETLLYELLNSEVDLIVTTGGVSVGDYDIMADFFTKWNGTTLFNKIRMRPGSPTTVGLWNNKLLFGLSGNPSACFVGFELFVRPLLHAMQREVTPIACEHSAFLAEDYMKVNAYTRYVRGRWYSENARLYALPVGLDKSSAMVTLKDANCLIVIPPTTTGLKAGEQVKIVQL